MATQTQKWMPLILIGGALWFLSRGGQLTRANGNGNGALNGYGEPGGPGVGIGPTYGGGGGPANVGGTLGGVNIGSAQSMGLYAHKADKYPGDLVNVDVDWNQATTDFNGLPIAWPSSMFIELGHPTGLDLFGYGLGGWDNMNDLLGGAAGSTTILGTSGAGATSGAKSWSASLAIPNVEDPGVNWDVRVTLSMEGSTAEGLPNGEWSVMDVATHQNAIRTLASVGKSNVGGWTDDIYVSNKVYMGQGQMRRLSMGQARPPGGIRTGEVRNWPTSNRNTSLPGVNIRVRQAGYMGRLGPGRQVVAV
jgi:hypothetical protein